LAEKLLTGMEAGFQEGEMFWLQKHLSRKWVKIEKEEFR
jgi:hypothetical protein